MKVGRQISRQNLCIIIAKALDLHEGGGVTSSFARRCSQGEGDGSIVELLSIEHGRTIRLAGELDMSNESELDDVLQAAVEQGGAILVDLSELTFMDSTGISAFLRAAVSLQGRGCLILHGEQQRVGRVLDLVRVDGSIPNLHRVHDAGLPSQNGSERDHAKVT